MIEINDFPVLEERRWVHPSDYGGHSPDGDIVAASQHRDSDLITQSNFRSIRQFLDSEGIDAYVFSASHWAVGWVEYLIVPVDGLTEGQARELNDALGLLEEYPVFDEEDAAALEYDEVVEWWGGMSLRERIERCAEGGASVFAARRDEIPSCVFMNLCEALYQG